jgi:hypothetical protein
MVAGYAEPHMCHSCDTGPRFELWSHPKDHQPRPTVGFEPATQGSLNFYTPILTTAQGKMCHIIGG